MNKEQIRKMYENYSYLANEDILIKIKDEQSWINKNHGAIATGLSAITGTMGVFGPILAYAAPGPVTLGITAAGITGLASTPFIGRLIERIKDYSDYARENLIDVISRKENIPKDQVFSRTIASGDRDALIALAFEKHKAIVDGSRNFETDASYKKAPNYRYTNIRYEAINMNDADKVFFDNAYKSLEKRYGRSDMPHDMDHADLKNNIVRALLLNDSGKLSAGEFSHIEKNTLAPINDDIAGAMAM